jgi:hypothetical protein
MCDAGGKELQDGDGNTVFGKPAYRIALSTSRPAIGTG